MDIGQRPNKRLEVSTVDGFQGREKEVIIISMVRSNAQQNIGFLSNEKRMNVAVTRAKRLCCLIGDSGTVASNMFLASLCAYFRENGQTRTAFDYAGNDEVRTGYGVREQTHTVKVAKPTVSQTKDTGHEGNKKMSKADRKKFKKEQERNTGAVAEEQKSKK